MRVGDKVRVVNRVLGEPWYGRHGIIVEINPRDMFPIVVQVQFGPVVCFDEGELKRV